MTKAFSKNLLQRVISALTLLPLVLGALWLGGWWWTAFLLLGGVLMAREWVALTIGTGATSGKIYSALLCLIVVLGVVHAELTQPDILLRLNELAIFAALGLVFVLTDKAPSVGWFFLGVVYVGVPLLTLWWLRSLDEGQIVFWLLFIVWATDVGGYFFGKAIGGPKLAVKISPKKTWAGLLGGMAVSVAVSMLIAQFFHLTTSLFVLVSLSALLPVWAQVGDLVESGIKRHFDVKDSGELIPGHGGLLDRVDGLVFVAPAMAILVYFLPHLFLVGS